MSTRKSRRKSGKERALLAARYEGPSYDIEESLQELEQLVQTAGGIVVGTVVQESRGFDPATFLGSGKVEEIAERIRDDHIDVVIFDHELSPSQNRNLENCWKTKVIDRTALILDIFARRASSREGKLQVELAQLNYLMPRLVGFVSHFSRLAGGIGTLGPGETKLEMERRRLRDRISYLKHELRKVQSQRSLQRRKRQSVPVPLVSLVGYTNAGKSSLMNRLTEAGVLVEDKLFATLDPRLRRVRLPSGRHFILADTVGFVRKLPHQLVEAFKATFQEIEAADIVLHVIDTPQEHVADQIDTVDTVLRELGLNDKKTIRVFNKMDRNPMLAASLLHEGPSVRVSAKTGKGLPALLEMIEEALAIDTQLVTLRLPYDEGASLSELYRSCRVLERHEEGEGILVRVEMAKKFLHKYSQFIEWNDNVEPMRETAAL